MIIAKVPNREQIEDWLLENLEATGTQYRNGVVSREVYAAALNEFNEFVVKRKLPAQFEPEQQRSSSALH